MKILFDAGTLVLEDADPETLPADLFPLLKNDSRTGTFRARACDYREIILILLKNGTSFTDCAKNFAPLEDLEFKSSISLRPHQQQALEAWKKNEFRGVAALPTGSGKTILAVYAIKELCRPAFVMVPTIDLMIQWVNVLERFFGKRIGMLGGGSRDIREITVSTYDSAVLNMEFLGDKFGFLIADECHHLPGPETRLAAAMCIAPFRLGLSATPELPPERASVLADMMGNTVCQIKIDSLKGSILSPYEIRQIKTQLDPDEAEIYRINREIYTSFLRRHCISFRSGSDWNKFIGLASRMPDGRKVFEAYLEQKRISRSGRAKIRTIREILCRNPGERIIIFTADNNTAYMIGRTFALPVITHHTKSAERKSFLENFRSGKYKMLVTSQVLNEGVDVPEASVGIVVSGTASSREHIQRLGRILRPSPGKAQAVLYELVSAGTSEESVSLRRRTIQQG